MESGDPIGRLFDRLDEWRALPAYKLEPRVDVFFSFYLRDVLERVSGKEIDELVIPEFPLRHGVIFKDSTENRSKKVDFALFGSRKSSNELFLVELKTDAGSAGDEQFEYLKLARKQRPHDLVQGAFDLLEATASRYKNKYRTLLDRLEKIGWSMRDQKSGAKSDRQGLWVVRIVYVVPSEETLTEQQRREADYVIVFDEFADIVDEKHQDEFSRRFSRSVRKWRTPPGARPE